MKIDIEKTLGIFEINIRNDSTEIVDRDRYYEFEMINNNSIPVFLECNIRNEDAEEFYSYNISSMISLRDYAEKTPLRYEELTCLVMALVECRRVICEYLLSPEGVIMEPEYIFYDKNRNTVRFCFYPWNTLDIHSSYTKLAEFLLLAVDYDDSESDGVAVKLAYEIYASVLNKDYELEKYVDYKVRSCDTENIDVSVDTGKSENIERTEMIRKQEYIEKKDEPVRAVKATPKRFSIISIFCVMLLAVIGIAFTATYIIDKNLVIRCLSNIRIMTMTILIISFLLYIPLMNLVDIKCYLVTNKQL